MFLRTEEFMPYAPDDIGRKARANHDSPDCAGGSNSMIVERKDDGVYAKCFRCGKFGRSLEGKPRHFFPTSKASSDGAYASRDVTMPRDSTTDDRSWPSGARVWVGQARVTPTESKTYGIAYSATLGRIVIPISSGGEFIGFLARKIFKEDEGPKYYMRTKQPTKMVFMINNMNHPDVVVLCEDVLSAIRIGRHVSSCAILGTEVSDYAINKLTKDRRHGIVFLDYDNRIVIKKSRVLKNRLELLLDKVHLINTRIDPKNLDDKELSDLLNLYI